MNPSEFLGAQTLDFGWAVQVKDRMVEGGVQNATTEQVNILWEAYQDAILEKKLSPFLEGQTWVPTLEDMVKVTGLPKMTVAGFLTALRALSYERGQMDYIDPAKGEKNRAVEKDLVKKILQAPARTVEIMTQPALSLADKTAQIVAGPLKWLAIIAAAGAVVYVAFQVSPLLKTKKRKG